MKKNYCKKKNYEKPTIEKIPLDQFISVITACGSGLLTTRWTKSGGDCETGYLLK